MQDDKSLTNVSGDVDNTDYIAAIKELKENSVDRAKYEALRADNKRLLDAVVNGQTVENTVKPQVDIQALRNELFNKENQTNLQYVENALKLRTALIESGAPDPFLPYGSKIVPTDEDIATANRVAAVLQECVDYADGDSAIFTNEVQRRTVDTAPRRK